MHRFYVAWVDGDTASISEAGQLHHLKNVLRLRPGDTVAVCDGEGNEYAGVITSVTARQAVIKVTASQPTRRRMKLTIACAIPKGDRMDDAIDQLTQLGIGRIIPMLTERVVVKLDDARKEVRLKRWRKIARNAAAQSQRSDIPAIDPVTGVADVIARSQDFDLKLIPHLSGERQPVKDVLAGAASENALVLIGPEGDFTPEELGLALGVGFVLVSLGDTVLRVATAAVAVAAYFRFAAGK